jgi:hypothetical protein
MRWRASARPTGEPDLVPVTKRAALDALLDPEAGVAVPGPSVSSVPRRRPPPEARSVPRSAAGACAARSVATSVAVHDQPLARGSSHDALEQPRSASRRAPSSTLSPGEPFPGSHVFLVIPAGSRLFGRGVTRGSFGLRELRPLSTHSAGRPWALSTSELWAPATHARGPRSSAVATGRSGGWRRRPARARRAHLR